MTDGQPNTSLPFFSSVHFARRLGIDPQPSVPRALWYAVSPCEFAPAERLFFDAPECKRSSAFSHNCRYSNPKLTAPIPHAHTPLCKQQSTLAPRYGASAEGRYVCRTAAPALSIRSGTAAGLSRRDARATTLLWSGSQTRPWRPDRPTSSPQGPPPTPAP